MTGAPVHPEVELLAFLLGTWVGEGKGEYPTIAPFRYREEVTFAHTGRPFLSYTQRTWHAGDGRPLHAETGYWRVKADRNVEVVLAHPTGVVEVEEGTLRGAAIELRSTAVAITSTAKAVAAVSRSFLVAGDVMAYELQLEAVGQPRQFHLAAELTRQR